MTMQRVKSDDGSHEILRMVMTRYVVRYGEADRERHKYLISVEPLSHPSDYFAAYIMDLTGDDPSEKVIAERDTEALNLAVEHLDQRHPELVRSGPRLRG